MTISLMLRFASSRLSNLLLSYQSYPITSRWLSGTSSSAFTGIDLIVQPNGLQLSTTNRQPWTNDAQPNPTVVRRKCNSRRCSELPSYLRTSSMQQDVLEKKPNTKQDTKPVTKAKVILAPPEKDLIKAAAAAREKARFGFLQSLRMNLAKI